MQEEAGLLGAHAVVDVGFEAKSYGWGASLIEFTAVGTAVRLQGYAPPPRPALTLLQPDALWKLVSAGYWPVGIAMGNCFWIEPHADCYGENTVYCSELPKHTDASQQARGFAVERFRAEAGRVGADGVVGVQVFRQGRDEEWEAGTEHHRTRHTLFHIEMLVVGTAVIKRESAARLPRPWLVVDLSE
jgi:uncharacterized protein YbjQ (UPF0145 family)